MAPLSVSAKPIVRSPFDASVQELVRYKCSCGCLNCMENMPSAEARLKKNRCANCFDCPHCDHTLSTRATSMAAPSPEDPTKMVAKKVYYLACAFCRWTSRDIGLPDQTVASGGWPEA